MLASALLPVSLGGIAFCLALYLCPRVIAAAVRYGIVDKPSTALKTQREPVAYLGGVVVFLAFLIALAIGFSFDERVLAILLCASLVVAVGLIDDLGTLVPRDKLIGQVIAAAILVKAGVKIELAAWPFPIDELFTVLWMVTCMNAFNILDVSDGLATTAALIGCLGVACLSLLHADTLLLSFSVALAGACGGFLWFNREPARIYLGDTGSMLLGTLLGAMVMLTRYSDTNDVAPFFTPMALLALPLFDLTLVVVARMAARTPVYYGSPDHFAVRLKDHGARAGQVALWAGAVGLVFAALGVAAASLPLRSALVVMGVGALLATALLGWILWRFPARTSPRFAPPVRGVEPATAVAPEMRAAHPREGG